MFNFYYNPDKPTKPTKPIYRIENDPNAMITMLPGESLHIGYDAFTETEAFEPENVGRGSKSKEICQELLPIRIPRGKIDSNRLAHLIHKFISCTEGAEKILPKFSPDRKGLLSRLPKKSLYHAFVRYSVFAGDTSIFTLQMEAFKYGEEEEYLEVSAVQNRGLGTVTRLFLNNLREYLESDGAVFNIVENRDSDSIEVWEDDDLINENYGSAVTIRSKPSKIKQDATPPEFAIKPIQFPTPKPDNQFVLPPPHTSKLSLMMPEPDPESEDKTKVSIPVLRRSTNSLCDYELGACAYNEIDDSFDINNGFVAKPLK